MWQLRETRCHGEERIRVGRLRTAEERLAPAALAARAEAAQEGQGGRSQVQELMEQCVRHLEKKEMCQVLGNAGKPFLLENLWDRWSRGLSFVEKILFPVEIRVHH